MRNSASPLAIILTGAFLAFFVLAVMSQFNSCS